MNTAPFLSRMLLRRNTWFIVLFQTSLIFVSLITAWLLRFDFSLPAAGLLFSVAPILIAVRLASFAAFHLFHGWWRFTGVSDIFDILKGVCVGSVGFFLTLYAGLGVRSFPRSVYILEPILTIGLLVGLRFLSRAFFESMQLDTRAAKRIAIIGAGAAAQMILRELRQPSAGCIVVACFDDDLSKKGLKIQGVPVLDTVDNMPAILARRPVEEIVIAVPSATSEQTRRFIGACEKTGVKFRTVPSLRELVFGEVTVREIRDVNLDDLLGRRPVQLDLGALRSQIQGCTVLVTGAAGSIGSELCRQLIQCQPKMLVCLDHNENGLFYLQRELAGFAAPVKRVYRVTDLCDRDEFTRICGAYRPAMVFHAAAHKHVGMMEWNLREVIRNNIFALTDLLEIAERSGCLCFVFVSSDKAVRPTSVMGATKRLGELILSSRPMRTMRCISVRFGNVLGSNGSVVPIFQEQIRRRDALTITHPDVRRFFMTIHEAVALVLQASIIGNHGEILVLDMDRPIRILDIARTLIRLSGKRSEDVNIEFTGLRPGEKLCEELFYDTEKVVTTCHPKIRSTRTSGNDWGLLQSQLQQLEESFALESDVVLRARLHSIVHAHSSPRPQVPERHAVEPSEVSQRAAHA